MVSSRVRKPRFSTRLSTRLAYDRLASASSGALLSPAQRSTKANVDLPSHDVFGREYYPSWAGTWSRNHSSARVILDKPDLVYPLGTGFQDCVERNRVCSIRNDRPKCASCVAQGASSCVFSLDAGANEVVGFPTTNQNQAPTPERPRLPSLKLISVHPTPSLRNTDEIQVGNVASGQSVSPPPQNPASLGDVTFNFLLSNPDKGAVQKSLRQCSTLSSFFDQALAAWRMCAPQEELGSQMAAVSVEFEGLNRPIIVPWMTSEDFGRIVEKIRKSGRRADGEMDVDVRCIKQS